MSLSKGALADTMPWFLLHERGGISVHIGSTKNINRPGRMRGRVLTTEEAREYFSAQRQETK